MIFVYLHRCSNVLQIIEYDIKSKYPKEYLTVNKVRSLMVNKLGCKKYSGAKHHHHHHHQLTEEQSTVSHLQLAWSRVV